jgi:ribosome-binding protein aMBF1 (putative translation factor)
MKAKTYSAEDVRNARRLLGMTQAELAKELGIIPSYLSGIERNQYPASQKVARNLDRALETHDLPDAIRGEEESRLIHIYRGLSEESRKAIMTTAEALHTVGKVGVAEQGV